MNAIRGRFTLPRAGFCLNAEFEIPGQGVTAIFGQSGSGKTTLLRCMAGLERAQNGLFVLNGQPWQDEQAKLFLPIYRRQLGYVFQDARLFPHLDVRGNLEFGWKRISSSERRIRFNDVVDWLGLEKLLPRFSDKLSGGEKQRVAIGRALLTCPKLLIMDEPLASLDSVAKSEILPYLERLHSELAVPLVYVSHALDEVGRLADHMLLLRNGRVVASGQMIDMMTRLDLSLSQLDEAGTTIEAVVAGHDHEFSLTYLDFAGGRITVAPHPSANGDRVRVRILAKDVSIALERPENTSILNIFKAEVIEVAEHTSSQMLLKLKVGDVYLLARITRKSASLLNLRSNQLVFAQVKSVALM